MPKRRSRFVRKRSSVFEPASLSRKEHGLSGRVEFCPCDFFRHPFPAAEVVVIGRVLHNWDMTRKKLLLKEAFDALPAGGAGTIYKRLIDDERRHNAKALLSSLNMLVMTTGGFRRHRLDA